MNKDVKNTIQILRGRIDELDEKILYLINQRLSTADDIGKIKEKRGTHVLDEQRERYIYTRLASLNDGPIRNEQLHHIFSEIIAASRRIQTPWNISYLGPEATFAHTAAMDHFGHLVAFLPQETIGDVFHEVERGACRYGVVPIENSIEGTLNNSLDLFLTSDLKICAELYRDVSYDLLAHETIDLNDVTQVFTDKHTIGLCRRWLKKSLKSIDVVKCQTTSEAVQKSRNMPNAAIIAGQGTGQYYKMVVIESGVEDTPHNVTRFLVIGREASVRTGKDKTSLMFVTPHVPGGLHKVLNPIALAGINMVKLESRPTRNENWQYLFFADIEGHIKDDMINKALSKMQKICLHLKILGSYPKAINQV